MRTERSRPSRATGAANENHAGGGLSTSTLPAATDIHTLPPAIRAAWVDGFTWGHFHGAQAEQVRQSEAFDAIAARYFRLIRLHEEIERETRRTVRAPSLAELARRRADTSTARSVPTVAEALASWVPAQQRRAAA